MKESESKEICPWCDTEIVWDEEIGREEQCPHCLNELSNYRTMNVDLDLEEDETRSKSVNKSNSPKENAAEDIEDINTPILDSFISKIEPKTDDLLQYEEGVYHYRRKQEESFECSNCHDFMIMVGDQEIKKDEFIPYVPVSQAQGILQAPYKLNLYICPSCFEMKPVLSEQDRLKMMDALKKQQEK
ncbi:hypothetical protein [Chengkuizengella axinellae]|uniref:Uncharacterized protein n=1 Tax=Chengkuizengella axinellae TaxID=3064388 RepID=A0ABT9J4N3_9BACL|nr:hypothetical protein [Chengkuizengella sp. 2205SS18-9]MDP5276586.1 hypothetical protein [Chengkuizengella sp. 2205SS18-9]